MLVTGSTLIRNVQTFLVQFGKQDKEVACFYLYSICMRRGQSGQLCVQNRLVENYIILISFRGKDIIFITKKLKLAVPCLIWFIGSPCQLDLLKDLGCPGSGKQEAWTSGQSRFVLKMPMINTEAKILPFQVLYNRQTQSKLSVHLKKSYLHVTNS